MMPRWTLFSGSASVKRSPRPPPISSMNANDEPRRLAIHELNFTEEGLAIDVDGGPRSSLSFLFCHPKPETARLVLINELNAGLFERCLNFQQSRNIAHKWSFLALNTPNGCNTNLSRMCNILLAPAEKRPGGTELCDLEHGLGELFDS
jgi:hypothetical protein